MGGNVTLRNVRGGLHGKTMGGNVRSEGSGGSGSNGPIELSTMGGNLEIREAPAGARLRTMGGEIHVGRAGEFVEAVTYGGDIRVDSVDGWVDLSTMGGDIQVRVTGTDGKRDVKVDSKGGEITVTVPASLAMNIDIELATRETAAGITGWRVTFL